jgi:hypothetical protein
MVISNVSHAEAGGLMNGSFFLTRHLVTGEGDVAEVEGRQPDILVLSRA